MFSEQFSKQITDSLSVGNMQTTCEAFSHLFRYSGTDQGEAAVDYITGKLDEYGVAYCRYRYEGLFSLPVKAALSVVSPGGRTYEALGCVFSGEADDLRAPLYYDALSLEKGLTEQQQIERYRAFRGKIVLSWEGRSSFAALAKKAGALAMVHIWKDDDALLHHSNIGPVWGTPTMQDYDRLTFLPAVTFRQRDARELIALCGQGEVRVSLNVKMDTAVRESSMPVASIPGKSEKYVLIAGHYDSWYEGITDNAAADAIMLELARVFGRHRDQLQRSVRIAWWSGHSDGRFAGSTWYCDQHFEDLKKNCVAYINLDICGCINTGKIIARTTLMEGMRFTADIIEDLTGLRPDKYVPMIKGADQSFWGVGVPIAFMAKNEPLPGNETLYGRFTCPGGGPWWHTVEDNIEKLDPDALLRDAKFNAQAAAQILCADHLPVHIPGFLDEMTLHLQEIMAASDPADFNLDPAMEKLRLMKADMKRFEHQVLTSPAGTTDDIVKAVAGRLVHLAYSMVDEYSFEPANSSAFAGGKSTFTGLWAGMHRTRDNTSPQTYLFLKTEFVRQRNRLMDTLGQVQETVLTYLGSV